MSVYGEDGLNDDNIGEEYLQYQQSKEVCDTKDLRFF